MGSAHGYICNECGTRFTVSEGGGFFFDLLHCDACGAPRSVRHPDLGDIHLRFVKGLPGPYAVPRSGMDRRIQAEYEGEPIDRVQYRELAEATLEPCACGGRFRYDAQPRCPSCRSAAGSWRPDPDAPSMLYD